MIIKCSHCRKILSSEDFESHKCEMPLVGVKNILVADCLDTSCKGKQIMTAWGVDGILYTFEVVPRHPIPIMISSDESLQLKKSDKDLTEPLSAILINVLTMIT